MDSERNLQILIELINKIMPALVILAACVIVYLFFNAELLKEFINLIVPITVYAIALYASYYFRSRKNKRMIREENNSEITIRINYFTFFYHDALVFCTPALIILAAFWLKGEVTYFDILYSAIAMTGLYLSVLIYKRKII